MTHRTTCSEVDCDRPLEARSLCKRHYARHRKAGTIVAFTGRRDDWFDKFLRSFDASVGPDRCWVWTAGTIKGYGTLYLEGRLWLTHRLSYALHNGDLPDGLVVRHSCDNPPCVNPRHLLIGTHAENMQDMAVRQRAASPLTVGDVAAIRAAYAAGGVSMSALGRQYGIAPASVHQIIHRKTWKHTP